MKTQWAATIHMQGVCGSANGGFDAGTRPLNKPSREIWSGADRSPTVLWRRRIGRDM